jgi:hypothetical protein
MIALQRGAETAVIFLFAIGAALSAFNQALPANTFPPSVEAEFVAAGTIVAGLANALTAFLTALHNQTAANTAAIAAPPAQNQENPK